MSTAHTTAEMDVRASGLLDRFTVNERIWLFTAAVAAFAGLGVDYVLPAEGLASPFRVPFVAMLVAVYVAELAVVHIEYGRHAHSFSMSEFALVLGLFFAAPDDLIMATIIGNAAVLAFHRRQPLMKLVFNVAQFTLQAVLALLIFRVYVGLGDPLSPLSWAGAALAVLSALLASDVLINTVIRIAGSLITVREQAEAFGVTVLAALLNTALALVAVVVLWLLPAAGFLAVIPPVALFMAYRAYMRARIQQNRTRMLYEATKQLHGTPRLELALAAAATSMRAMLNAERAQIVIAEADGEDLSLTSSGPGDELVVMRPAVDGEVDVMWRGAVDAGCAIRFDNQNALAAPLMSPEGTVLGAVIVRNRLGDIAGFDDSDLATAITFSAQIASTISNNRLMKSLADANALARERESLIRAKDDFLASVSHELRTPLTSVLGLSQELASVQNDISVEERSELMGVIAEQSGELSNLVDDLLVSARSDIGTLYMSNEPVELTAEIDRVLRDVATPSEIVVDADDVFAWCDPLRLRQIVRNLVSNAHRYGGDQVSIQITERGGEAHVRVIDNGSGVPEELTATIFEPYGRAHEPGSQPASIGLGLHVASRLAERMGGDLSYLRDDDRTVFELALRLAEQPLSQQRLIETAV